MENKAHALAAGIFVIVVSVMLIAMAAWLVTFIAFLRSMRGTGQNRRKGQT